jgi:hypothetical protein
MAMYQQCFIYRGNRVQRTPNFLECVPSLLQWRYMDYSSLSGYATDLPNLQSALRHYLFIT